MLFVEKKRKVEYDARKRYPDTFWNTKETIMEIDVKKFSKPCSCGKIHHIQVKDIILGK